MDTVESSTGNVTWSHADLLSAVSDPDGWAAFTATPDPEDGRMFVHRSGVGVRHLRKPSAYFVIGSAPHISNFDRLTWAPCPMDAVHAMELADFQAMLRWSFCSPNIAAIHQHIAVYLSRSVPSVSGTWTVYPRGEAFHADHPEFIFDPCLVGLVQQLLMDTHYLALSPFGELLSSNEAGDHRLFLGAPDSIQVHVPASAHGRAVLMSQVRKLPLSGSTSLPV